MSVKICGYCRERCKPGGAERVDFDLPSERKRIVLWFCSTHCIFWGGVKHHVTGSATTLAALRERFGPGVEVVK